MTAKKKITAAELMAELNADPEWRALRAIEEEDRRSRVIELRRAQQPLLSEIRSLGCTVNSVWDLVNSRVPYTKMLPTLFEHLQHPYPDVVREGIARALAVPEAKYGWTLLVRLYASESGVKTKEGLAVALAATSDDDVIDDVIGLLKDRRHGKSRVLLLHALQRSSVKRAQDAFLELAQDSDLRKEIGARKKGKKTSINTNATFSKQA